MSYTTAGFSQTRTCIYKKYNLIFLFFNDNACGADFRNSWWKLNFSQNSRLYLVLKLPCNPHGHASSPIEGLFYIVYSLSQHNARSPLVTVYIRTVLIHHWSRLTSAQFSFTIGHGLHPHNSHSPLVTAYIRTILIHHWSRLTSAQFSFTIGHGLHPHNSHSPLVTAYIRTILIHHWSRLTPTHFFMPEVSHPCIARFSGRLSILSMTGYICQLHLLGSSPVKAIYYTKRF